MSVAVANTPCTRRRRKRSRPHRQNTTNATPATTTYRPVSNASAVPHAASSSVMLVPSRPFTYELVCELGISHTSWYVNCHGNADRARLARGDEARDARAADHRRHDRGPPAR